MNAERESRKGDLPKRARVAFFVRRGSLLIAREFVNGGDRATHGGLLGSCIDEGGRGRWEIGRFEQNAPLPILIASTNVQLDQMMRVSNEVQRKEACGGRVLFVLFERIRL